MRRHLRPGSSTVRAVNLLIVLVVSGMRLRLLLLLPPLSVPVHEHLNGAQLLNAFLLRGNVVIDKEIFADEYALLVDDIVELSLFLLDDVLLVVLLVIVIVVLFIVKVLLRLLLLLLLHVVQLIEDVLDLSLELLVALLHQVLQHLGHAELLGLLSKTFPGEDRVERAVHVRTHLQVIVLHQVVQYLQKLYAGVLALIFTGCS